MTRNKTESDRFWEKVNKTESCWIWIAGKTNNEYGCFREQNSKTMTRAHRWSYANLNGPIPEGLQIDHLCRNKLCVNPEHLEAVSMQENLNRGLRSKVTKERHAKITHCPRGHEYSIENTRYGKSDGYEVRSCRECGRQSCKAYYAKTKGK